MSSDEEVIEKMKEIEKIYLTNYSKLSMYKEQNRVLQKELEKILFVK